MNPFSLNLEISFSVVLHWSLKSLSGSDFLSVYPLDPVPSIFEIPVTWLWVTATRRGWSGRIEGERDRERGRERYTERGVIYWDPDVLFMTAPYPCLLRLQQHLSSGPPSLKSCILRLNIYSCAPLDVISALPYPSLSYLSVKYQTTS